MGRQCHVLVCTYKHRQKTGLGTFIHLVVEGKVVEVVFLDFSKASDAVPHSILLDNLSNCGMSRFTVRWVKNLLKGGAQQVVVNGATSDQSPAVFLRAQF